jgi:hypothetical protein
MRMARRRKTPKLAALALLDVAPSVRTLGAIV